ncbi:MAG: isochorismatase family protein [Thiotrichales bacterium]|nr:isochorismatase family protein [Thiotrichales bacterium]
MITELDKHSALILIDLQQGILQMASKTPPQPGMSSVAEALENASALISAFRKNELPIVIVNVNSYGQPWTKTRKDNPLSGTQPPNEDYLKIVDEIETLESDIFITKHSWSAFFNTGLHEALQQRNVTHIVLGGVATSIGAEGTARDASVLGYNLSFAIDAMSDFTQEAHQHTVTRIFPRIGEVGTTQEIIDKLPTL